MIILLANIFVTPNNYDTRIIDTNDKRFLVATTRFYFQILFDKSTELSGLNWLPE